MIGRAGAGVTMGRETQPRPHIALASGQCQNTRFPLIAHTGAVRELYTHKIMFILGDSVLYDPLIAHTSADRKLDSFILVFIL